MSQSGRVGVIIRTKNGSRSIESCTFGRKVIKMDGECGIEHPDSTRCLEAVSSLPKKSETTLRANMKEKMSLMMKGELLRPEVEKRMTRELTVLLPQ